MKSLVLLLIMSLLVITPAAVATEVDSTTVPLCFIQNNGQLDEQVLYFVDAPGFSLYLTGTGEVLYPVDALCPVAVTYAERNCAVRVTGDEQLPGMANFFLGNDAGQWATNVPTYASVQYADLYDGISLVYSVDAGTLKREFVVDPGASPGDIVMVYSGQESLSLDESGAILIGTSDGVLLETAPVCYQVVDGQNVPVTCGYVISGDAVSFSVGSYNAALPLIIDPVLVFSTYFGGTNDDMGAGIGLDDWGNVYIVGSTKSTNLPLPNAPVYQEHLNGSWDIFVAKMSPDGSQLLYSTYIGGNRTDMAGGIVVNNATGEVFITGYTLSANYPETLGATYWVNLEDIVITGVDQFGSGLIWSRYFGGNKTDEGTAITFDSGGNPVVVGFTNSPAASFPGVTFSNSLSGSYDALIVEFGIPDGFYINQPRYLGGTGADYAYGVDTDSGGNIWVTGYTNSMLFPTTPGVFRRTPYGLRDIFITEFAPTLGAPMRSTYLGGAGDDFAMGIAIGPGDYPYVTGYTESGVSPISLFPIKPYFDAFQTTYGGGTYDAFITKMQPDLSALNYSTYLGGNYEDKAFAIVVDDMGNAYVTGSTDSTNFPTMNPYQAFRDGLVCDAFLTEMNTTGTGLVYSTYFGGTYYDVGKGIAITGDGLNMTFTGYTESINFPILNAYQPYLAGFPPVRKTDAFISKFLKVPPVANFTGEPAIGCSPLTVYFNDTSTNNPTSWLWDFGDGNTSTEQNPNHTYVNPSSDTPQNFTVNLTACNLDGCGFISKVNFTRVCPNQYYEFTANQSGQGCVGANDTLIFNGSYISGSPWVDWWFDFGDNTTVPHQVNIHQYTTTGIFNVTFYVESECCVNSTVHTVDIRAVPVADFYAIPTIGLIPLDVSFFDNSSGRPSSWYWTFGPGQGTSTEQNPEHTYDTKGVYRVRLQACNFCGCDWENKTAYIRAGLPNLTFMPPTLVVPTNDTTPIDLYLERAESGLSGYDLHLFWGDTVHGNITSVKFPSWAANQTIVGPLPAPTITVRAVDLMDYITPGATNVYLGTFNLTGLSPTYPSSMWFNVSVNELDDNFGDPVYTNEIPAEITVVRLLPFPGKVNPPTDPDGDQVYWDVNGNGLIDFSDVVTYFQNMQWIRDNQYVPFFDYNGNGLIDFADLIMLFHKV